jgi:hypothetical protein
VAPRDPPLAPDAGRRTGLPAYAAARHPEVTPLSPDTLRAALATPGRARSGSRDGLTASAFPRNAQPTQGPLVADTAPTGSGQPVEGRVVAEAKLDRLLQSFLR